MQTIYLCTLPLGWTIILSTILIGESSYRAYTMAKRLWLSNSKQISVVDKNLQYGLDIVVDTFFLLVPLTIIVLWYDVWITVEETSWILFSPSLSLLGKLRRLMLESTNQRAEATILRHRDAHAQEISVKIKRTVNRASIFGRNFNEKITAVQNNAFPRSAKLFVFTTSIFYVTFLSSLLVSQIAAFGSNMECDKYISDDIDANQYWEDGCEVKVPLCKDTYKPKCDCVIVNIENHNMTELSRDKFVELTSLRSVFVKRGPLKHLPRNMEKLRQMNRFDVSFNDLQSFDVDVLQWNYLSYLVLMFNNISMHNERLWRHPNLVNLMINSNHGFSMPQDVKTINLPRLVFFDGANNSGVIPKDLSASHMPALNYLYLDGNLMNTLPNKFSTFKANLLFLGVARCGLTRLDYIEDFEKLTYVDARNNSIVLVSSEIQGKLKSANVESYFSGNPACKIYEDLNCAPLCTDYCWSERGFGDRICDESCDSRECRYDGGDCIGDV
eukprot:g6377.t1